MQRTSLNQLICNVPG